MKYYLFALFVLAAGVSFSQSEHDVPMKVVWSDTLSGDFSFTDNWSYPLGVELKPNGKAGCADGGFCPERCYGMLDENGVVLRDSAEIFYQLLDTTHQFHTIQSETNCYEWDGTDFIEVLYEGKGRKGKRNVFCFTTTGIATHCELQIEIAVEICEAQIKLNSITSDGDAIFYCSAGSLTIDRKLWKKGIMKAEFSFFFTDPGSCEPIYWNGRIYTKIKSKGGI